MRVTILPLPCLLCLPTADMETTVHGVTMVHGGLLFSSFSSLLADGAVMDGAVMALIPVTTPILHCKEGSTPSLSSVNWTESTTVCVTDSTL